MDVPIDSEGRPMRLVVQVNIRSGSLVVFPWGTAQVFTPLFEMRWPPRWALTKEWMAFLEKRLPFIAIWFCWYCCH